MGSPRFSNQIDSARRSSLPVSIFARLGLKSALRRVGRALAGLIGIVGLTSVGPAAAQDAPPPEVVVATPLVDRVLDWDEYTGRFQAREAVTVQARVSGYLDHIHFEDGQMVEAGDLLFTIDQRPFQLAAQRAEAMLDAAQASLRLAEVEQGRASRLVDRNVGTQQDLDRARAEYAQSLASVALAEADLNIAQLDLSFTEIRAPISGRISASAVDEGALIIGGPTGAMALTNVVSVDPIDFVFTASEADFLRYSRLAQTGARPGSRTNPNRILAQLMDEDTWDREGQMDFVDNRLDPNSGTIEGRAVFQNDDGFLQPGIFARARLIASQEYEAVMIPDEAIVADQARSIVYVVGEDDIVEARIVQRGALWRGLRIIAEGLAAGDRVVISGLQRARPGAPVVPRDEPLAFASEAD
ncbi:MAG: efflux RND transporter periplasmic adaptor subunit [Pseudomonadota bacterium]